MIYDEFIESLKKLYRKYFKEDGISSKFKSDQAQFVGFVWDEIVVKMPKGLDGIGRVTVSSQKKDYIENGLACSLKVQGQFYVHLDKGKKTFKPITYYEGQFFQDKWNGKMKQEALLKKFDGLFREMLKLLTAKKNDKYASMARRLVISALRQK